MKLFYPLSILLVTSFMSCATLESISLDQLYPAEVSFPPAVKEVAVLNNMVVSPSFSSHRLTQGKWSADGSKLAGAFAQALADNNYFNQVVICDSALREAGDEATERILSQREVQQLSQSLHSDLLISADVMNVRVKRDEYYFPGFPDPFPMLRADAYSLVRVYIPSRSKPLLAVTAHDSLFWDVRSGVTDSLVVNEMSHHVAASLVAKIVPQWKKIDRVYFDGVCAELRDGAVCFRENDSEGARKSWTALYTKSRKGALKVKAAFNLALLSELEGDIDSAISWLKQANTFSKDGSEEKYLIIKYMDVLMLRKDDLSKLNIQMHRFQN